MTNQSIGAIRQQAINAVNLAAGEARSRHHTAGMGQDMVYSAKLAQATAYIAAHALDSGAAVPAYVAADVAAVGGTALEAAQAIVGAAEAFHTGPGPQIEQARRAAKVALMAADAEDVGQALADALGALESI